MTVTVYDSAQNHPLDSTIISLRRALNSETIPLAKRFRALFSLKHLASNQPPSRQTFEAIQAIAAAFESPSVLLKHELAYCLGQTKNLDAIPFLRHVLEDPAEDEMCRHEAAEALGALGDKSSVDFLRRLKDDESESAVVRETCEIAVDRILWKNSEAYCREEIKQRCDVLSFDFPAADIFQ
jgi:deoxyhypusine monooxygenase